MRKREDRPDNHYELTDTGMRMQQGYAWTHFTAREALKLADWLLRHYVQLYEMAREKAKSEMQQKGDSHGTQKPEADGYSALGSEI